MSAQDARRNFLPYLAGAVLVVLLAMRACGGGEPSAPAVSVDGGPQAPTPAERRSGGSIWVHVAGAVRRPGLYRVRGDARAGAAVDAAGGITRRADLRAINLAATVRDGQQVLVPARGERPPGPATAAAPGASGAGAAPGTTGAAGGAKLSLATATVEQLDTLDGIGPTLAKRILEWRDAHGGFQSIEQLREVDGIGDKRFESLRAAVQP